MTQEIKIPTSPPLNTQLANAVTAVVTAQHNYERLREERSRAQREETIALNKANEAQRRFDALVAEVKKSAPYDTDWRQAIERGE